VKYERKEIISRRTSEWKGRQSIKIWKILGLVM
jgi:hypothetical protein